MKTHFPHTQAELESIARRLLEVAARQGATDASASIFESNGHSANLRQGRIRALSREVRCGVSLTVHLDQRRGSTHSTDMTEASLNEMARAALEIAGHAEADPFASLPETDEYESSVRELELFHPWEPSSEDLIDLARRIEAGIEESPEAASEGAWVANSHAQQWLANSRGFSRGYAHSSHTLAASVIASRGEVRTIEYAQAQARRAEALPEPDQIGREAAVRGLRMLSQGPARVGDYPVLFEARAATSLLEHLCGAISGRALYTNASCLSERFGTAVFPQHICVEEDPFIPEGLASAPFDSEGISGRRRLLVDAGILQERLLAHYSARRLGLRSTGNARGPYNIRLRSDLTTPADDMAVMMRKLGTGLLVTSLDGDGVQLLNGDYSRAVRGLWVENGLIRHAVAGVTIAGNLLDIWRSIASVGTDLYTEGPFTTGSVLVASMHVAAR